MSDDLAARRARHQPIPSRNFHTGAIEADWCATCRTTWGEHGCDAAVLGDRLFTVAMTSTDLKEQLQQERQARQAAEAELAQYMTQYERDTERLAALKAAEARAAVLDSLVRWVVRDIDPDMADEPPPSVSAAYRDWYRRARQALAEESNEV